MTWTVATFNVNSVRSRLPILERWLNHSKVDVLCLQETKTQDETFPEGAFRNWGYSVVFRGEKSYNGVAVASLIPPDQVVHGFDDGQDPSFDTRGMAVRFGSTWIVNTYVPQGKSIDHQDYQVKKTFLKRVRILINRLAQDGEVLWLGDLNVAPEDMDVTNPKTKAKHVCFHHEIKEEFARTRNNLVDVFRKHRPDPGEFSFWDYRVKNALDRNIGWRIDHLLATPALADRSRDSWVDRSPRGWDKPSDHTPVMACFDGELVG
ncbi:MAG: exodeoxyribonuclease III [Dethiosulfovibrio peptidovorans]|nr:MAG: exodeoxyribonuclease III [Dethiosulfovibrio peptidovorans]